MEPFGLARDDGRCAPTTPVAEPFRLARDDGRRATAVPVASPHPSLLFRVRYEQAKGGRGALTSRRHPTQAFARPPSVTRSPHVRHRRSQVRPRCVGICLSLRRSCGRRRSARPQRARRWSYPAATQLTSPGHSSAASDPDLPGHCVKLGCHDEDEAPGEQPLASAASKHTLSAAGSLSHWEDGWLQA